MTYALTTAGRVRGSILRNPRMKRHIVVSHEQHQGVKPYFRPTFVKFLNWQLETAFTNSVEFLSLPFERKSFSKSSFHAVWRSPRYAISPWGTATWLSTHKLTTHIVQSIWSNRCGTESSTKTIEHRSKGLSETDFPPLSRGRREKRKTPRRRRENPSTHATRPHWSSAKENGTNVRRLILQI